MLAVSVPQMKENCMMMSVLCLHKASKENPAGYYKQPPLGGEGLFSSCAPSETRSPLPSLRWAASGEVWAQMRQQDVVKSAPEADLQVRHPGIVPSMRVILLDWMLEVCTYGTVQYVCVCVCVCTVLYCACVRVLCDS